MITLAIWQVWGRFIIGCGRDTIVVERPLIILMQLCNFHCCMFMFFVTLPHISGRVLWFHFGRLCIHPTVIRPSVFLLLDNSLSKYQWIFTKLGMCIDVEILFGIINGQILSVFDSYLPAK